MNEQSALQRFLKDDLFRWKIFIVHFILFCVSLLLGGWTTMLVTTTVGATDMPPRVVSSTPYLILYPISLIWLVVITLHFSCTLLNEKRRVKKNQLAEKPKRQNLEVGDDGELIETVEFEEVEKRKNTL